MPETVHDIPSYWPSFALSSRASARPLFTPRMMGSSNTYRGQSSFQPLY